MTFLLITLTYLFQVLIYLKSEFIAQRINFYDNPNSSRKIHKKPIPITGGFLVLLILPFILYYISIELNLSLNSLLGLAIIVYGNYLIGLVDDVIILNPISKTILSFIIFLLGLMLCSEIVINELMSLNFQNNFYLGFLAIPFTILCFLLNQNALNMMDGANGVLGLFSIFLFCNLFFIVNETNFQILIVIIVISLIIFYIFNVKNKIFLGNHGSYGLSGIISVFIIVTYNQYSSHYLNIENIFLLLSLPFFDMCRLFFSRIKNKKNPSSPDTNHLHHILLRKLSGNNVMLTYVSIYILLTVLIFLNFKYSIILSFIFFYSFYQLINKVKDR